MKTHFLLLSVLFFVSGCDSNDNPAPSQPPEETQDIEAHIANCDPALLHLNSDINMDFDVFSSSEDQFNLYRNYFENLKSTNPEFNHNNITFKRIPTNLNTGNKFRGGALAKNGVIFFYPQTFKIKHLYAFEADSEYLCKIDIPNEVSGIWSGGTTLPSGKIISFPVGGNNIIEVDPYSLTVKVIAQTDGTFGGQILASNGFLYGVPNSADHILKLNPETYETVKIGSFEVGSSKWYSSALGPNGKIYGIPLVANKVLQLDPTDDSYQFIGADLGQGRLKWAGSALGSNGKIYGVPDDAEQILEINPFTEQTRLIGDLGSTSQKWSFGFIGPDAKIYMTPDDNATTVLQFDPETDEIKLLGDFQGRDKWNGVIQANGNYYAIPDSSDSILKISFESNENVESFIQLSPFINKY